MEIDEFEIWKQRFQKKEDKNKEEDISCEDLVNYCDTEKILNMPMDNIVFMKHYFKSKGFDPESEDFITEFLKLKYNNNTYSYTLDII